MAPSNVKFLPGGVLYSDGLLEPRKTLKPRTTRKTQEIRRIQNPVPNALRAIKTLTAFSRRSHKKIDPKCYDCSPIITLVVGGEEVQLKAHKDLLVVQSAFFTTCLAAGMRESLENKIEFPTDDPMVFRILIHWLYTRRLPSVRNEDQNLIMMMAWIRVDQLMMLRFFPNDLIDEIAKYWQKNLVSPREFTLVLDHLTPHHQLYRLATECFVHDSTLKPRHYGNNDGSIQAWGPQMKAIVSRSDLPVEEMANTSLTVLNVSQAKRGSKKPGYRPEDYYIRDGTRQPAAR
ncbi:hypothetical protein LTR84_007589 [Exophiala bonariae]|uniref:BTB domain-containing protein n=1 Tax=Exophiala bonariae TaxID=1690606 RepID=A0AAV9NLJ9_9EURO|nr:hypothetical protein LTR84_007589 [Exophiala bonariae]